MRRFLILLLVFVCALPVFAQSAVEVADTEQSLKVVSLAPNVTEIIYALGAGDLLVGRTDYCNYPLEVLDKTSIGTLWEPNLETILALDADIAIASSIVSPDFIESLNKAGIQAYQFYEEESLEGTFTLVQKVADSIGKAEEGEKLVQSMRNRVNAVTEKVCAIRAEDRKSAAYIIGYGDWGDYGATGETFLDGVIEAAGGINALESGVFWSISRELLISEDPYVIILPCYSYSTPEAEIAAFTTTEPYSNLTACKEGRVYTIDGDSADRQGVRTVDTIEAIARILYPELF